MKKTFNYITALFILTFLFAGYSYCYSSSDYEKIADKITAKTAKMLKEKKGLCPAGSGGRMMKDIQMMMIGFNFYHVVDKEMARQLLIDSVESYLSEINSNEKIRPYLHNYPFTAQNVEIIIYFYNSEGYNVPPGKISIAAAIKGTVEYYTDDSEKHTIKSIHEETYQDALNSAFENKNKR